MTKEERKPVSQVTVRKQKERKSLPYCVPTSTQRLTIFLKISFVPGDASGLFAAEGSQSNPTLLCAPGLSNGHDSDPGKSKPSQDSPLLSSVLRVFSTRFRGRHLPRRAAAVPWAGAEGVRHRFLKRPVSFAVLCCLGPETEPCSWSRHETASCKPGGRGNLLRAYRGPLPSPKPSHPAPTH